MKHYLGIDLGGTNVAVGVVTETGGIIARGHRPCPRGAAPVAAAIIAACQDAVAAASLDMAEITAAGLGSPGIIDSVNGIVIFAANLELNQAPLCAMVSGALGVPVVAGNDANVAAYGEFLFGAGRGTRDMVAVTLGTGLGCGIVIDGKLYSGFNSFAGEAGHMILKPGGRPCTCGRLGCFEAYSSATGLMATARAHAERQPDSVLHQLTSGDLSALDGKLFFQAVEQGDSAAVATLEEYTTDLAIGLGGIVNLLQPEVICVGGGIAGAGEVLLDPLRSKVREYDFAGKTDTRVKILPAALGNDAGIIGAALLPEM